MRNTFSSTGEADVPSKWKVGDVILDQYEVLGILGEGGMGTVYKVHHRSWNTNLAVKSPKSEIFAKADGKEHFIREAKTWMNLGLHPHIVGCYYVRILGDIPRIFAEYIAGGCLLEWIEQRLLYTDDPEQTLERILDIAIQFAWGLQYAHEQLLVHQDVKPANVMMTADGIVKVTDFGLAQARTRAGGAATPEERVGQSVMVPGVGLMTRAYASPEQARGKPLTYKTDFWSWGVSILEMFAGGRFWQWGPSIAESLDVYLENWSEVEGLPRMPAQLIALLRNCFQENPANRPQSMLKIAEELQHIYQQAVGRPYPRQSPRPTEALADTLNNRALSLLDLGQTEEAEQAWALALQSNPQHLETTYNQGVVLWRRGVLTDDVLVRQLAEMRAAQSENWQAAYFLAQVHLERGDMEAALPLLDETAQQTPEEVEVQALFKQVQSGSIPTIRCLWTLSAHTNRMNAVSLSADGNLVLSGSSDRTMRLREVATKRFLRIFEGHSDGVNAVSLSADGSLAISGSSDRTARLWDVATGRCLRIFEGHSGAVESVSLSADSSLALSASDDKTLRLWDVATGRCLRIFGDGTTLMSPGSLSADGSLVISDGGYPDAIQLWETATGSCLRTFTGHGFRVTGVLLSTDGKLALSGSWDRTLRLWEVVSGQCLRVFEGHRQIVMAVSLSTDGKFALSGGWDGTMRLWEIATGRCLRTFAGSTEQVCGVTMSSDGSLVLSGGADGTMRAWAVPHERFLCSLRLSQVRVYAHLSQIETQAAVFLQQAEQARSERRFATALNLLRNVRALPGWERTPQVLDEWSRLSRFCSKVDLRSVWLTRVLKGHTHEVTSVSLSADGQFALSGSMDKTVRLWESATGCCLHTLTAHSYITTVSLNTDGRLALFGTWDNTVCLWEVTTGHCLHIFTGHTDHVTSVSLSADSRFVLSGSKDKTIRWWEVATGRCLRTFTGHTDHVTSVSLSADGRYILSGSKDKTIRWWEVATGRCLRTFEGHMDGVTSVSLSADGQFALSGSMDYTLRLWKLTSRESMRTFQEKDNVSAVSLSADGRLAVSASGGHTVHIWKIAMGHCLYKLEGHTSEVTTVCMSADRRWALSGSKDRTVRLWEMDWELRAHEETDWDEGARPYLHNFLIRNIPGKDWLSHWKKPQWDEDIFQQLLTELSHHGFGWLRPEGVRATLEDMASHWQGPPRFGG